MQICNIRSISRVFSWVFSWVLLATHMESSRAPLVILNNSTIELLFKLNTDITSPQAQVWSLRLTYTISFSVSLQEISWKLSPSQYLRKRKHQVFLMFLTHLAVLQSSLTLNCPSHSQSPIGQVSASPLHSHSRVKRFERHLQYWILPVLNLPGQLMVSLKGTHFHDPPFLGSTRSWRPSVQIMWHPSYGPVSSDVPLKQKNPFCKNMEWKWIASFYKLPLYNPQKWKVVDCTHKCQECC